MDGWQEVYLKNICETQYGYTASATEIDTGVKYVRITDIVPDFINWKTVPFCEISENDFLKYKLNEGDIVAARTGATVGYAKQIRKDVPNAVFASYLVKIIPCDQVNKKFIGILLESSIYKEFIQKIAGGSAQPNANANDLTSFKIKIPPVITQRKIALILSAYDELIEINKSRVKLLENIAEEIYKEWFVRLRFPDYLTTKFINKEGHECKPGSLGALPEGWENDKIGNICKVGRGSSPRPITDNQYFINGTIPWIKIADATASSKFILETNEYVNEYGASFSRYLEEGSLIIATSGTLGFCIFLGTKGCIHDGWLYTYDYKKSIKPSYLYFRINSLTKYFNNFSYGAAIQNINTEILRKTSILIPPKEILNKFYSIIDPIDKEHKILLQKTQLLQQTRDLLLPRLINGKLSVDHLVEGVD